MSTTSPAVNENVKAIINSTTCYSFDTCNSVVVPVEYTLTSVPSFNPVTVILTEDTIVVVDATPFLNVELYHQLH
jgi:hypothetical protein